MGIKSAFRDIVRQARRSGSAERDGRVSKTWTGASGAIGEDRAEADEKIIRASLVADEWDGALALFSRRA
jgi:hypothetical protein